VSLSFIVSLFVPKAADIGSKRLISLAPDAWVQWVMNMPNVRAIEILGSEFQWVSRESDVLVKAYHPQQGEFLVLNELQLRYKTTMPRRMRAYAALAEERYGIPTYPVLVNILPPPSTLSVCDRYESEFFGIQARQDYRVINLWEVEVEQVFQTPLPSLLPFVPILRGGNEVRIVQRALQTLQADEELSQLETLLAFFARFVLDTELVTQIMRWDMTVLRESPWYQEIEVQQLVRALQRRFGEVPEPVLSRLQGLTSNQTDRLLDITYAVSSLEEFINFLSTELGN
jgi:predicted transposase YdaD